MHIFLVPPQKFLGGGKHFFSCYGWTIFPFAPPPCWMSCCAPASFNQKSTPAALKSGRLPFYTQYLDGWNMGETSYCFYFFNFQCSAQGFHVHWILFDLWVFFPSLTDFTFLSKKILIHVKGFTLILKWMATF